MTINLKEETQKIVERLSAEKISANANDIEKQLRLLVVDYHVPLKEAGNSILKKYGYKFTSGGMGGAGATAEVIPIAKITGAGAWVSVRGKITELWDSSSDAIHQTGLIADETGMIKFTIFKKNAGQFTVEEGSCYELTNVVTSEFNGRLSINLNKNSGMHFLTEDIEVLNTKAEFVGVITQISNGSGFIKSCPECNRALVKAACSEHGKVEGKADLRIKAVFVSGSDSYDIIAAKEVTEKVLGYDIAAAKERAMEALDAGVIAEELGKILIGKFFKISGSVMDKTSILASSIEPFHYSPEKIEEIQQKIVKIKGVI